MGEEPKKKSFLQRIGVVEDDDSQSSSPQTTSTTAQRTPSRPEATFSTVVPVTQADPETVALLLEAVNKVALPKYTAFLMQRDALADMTELSLPQKLKVAAKTAKVTKQQLLDAVDARTKALSTRYQSLKSQLQTKLNAAGTQNAGLAQINLQIDAKRKELEALEVEKTTMEREAEDAHRDLVQADQGLDAAFTLLSSQMASEQNDIKVNLV